MSDYRAQERQFKTFVRDAVVPHVPKFNGRRAGVVQSDDDEDRELSFDLRVGLWVPVSVRLRRNRALAYRDISIRSKTKFSGQIINGQLVKCEIDKLTDGHGCCYFYGWLSPDEQQIVDYVIVDIDALRPHLNDKRRYTEKPNPDGATWARYYSLEMLYRVGSIIYDAGKEASAA